MTTQKSETTTALKPMGQPDFEPFLTIAQVAEKLGVHTWALRRAVAAGKIPAYTPFNGRKLLRLSEVVAAINAAKLGGLL